MVTDLRSLPSGFTLSDYRIEHVLGQGGFGITYLGVDTHLGRKVAIKEYYPREWAVRNNSYTINSAGSPDARCVRHAKAAGKCARLWRARRT